MDATTEKYKTNYRMYSYITKELPGVVEQHLPVVKGARSISGHSMGGHGALICALKNPGLFKVATAFAPISNPSVSAWGIKCFTGYLGEDKEAWKDWDATELIAKYQGPELHLRIEQVEFFLHTLNVCFLIKVISLFQGSADPWLGHLIPDNFVQVCKKLGVNLDYRWQEGYEHGYLFVGTFIGEHIKLHSDILRK